MSIASEVAKLDATREALIMLDSGLPLSRKEMFSEAIPHLNPASLSWQYKIIDYLLDNNIIIKTGKPNAIKYKKACEFSLEDIANDNIMLSGIVFQRKKIDFNPQNNSSYEEEDEEEIINTDPDNDDEPSPEKITGLVMRVMAANVEIINNLVKKQEETDKKINEIKIAVDECNEILKKLL